MNARNSSVIRPGAHGDLFSIASTKGLRHLGPGTTDGLS